MILYSLQQIKKSFGDKTILDIDDLEIEKGYIYALLGPNGSGKTTLLNILGFLDHPTSGQISFLNSPVVFNERSLQPLRKKVVMVNQNPILFTTTVFKNLEFGLKIRKIPRIERLKRIREALELVGLQQFEQAPAHKLSGGETQRIVIARALVLSPEVILCDEPTASVDLENQIKISRLLRDINQEKKISLVFTSHDKRQAASLPHHRIFLEQGRTSRLSYENIFPSHFLNDKPPIMQLAHKFLFEKSAMTRDRSGRFRIDPEAIQLEKITEEIGEPAITGQVTRISLDREKVRVAINCGVRLTVILSQNSYQKTNLLVGEKIKISVPPHAVSFLN